MQRFLLTLTTIFLTSAQLSASWWNPFSCDGSSYGSCGFGPLACSSSPWPSPINLDIGMGYRRDTFRWSKARREREPDVLSELEWKDIRIIEYGGSASYVSCRNYAIKAWGSYGHIYHGKNIDSDYFSDRRKDLISRSVNKAGKGHVYDASGAVGYRVTSTCRRFIGTPLIGYSDHAQYLHIFDGNQVVSRLGLDPLGHFPGLNSRYKTRWFGPWAGLDFTTQVEKCAYVFGSFEWHLLSYRGEGCWNLRSDMGPIFHRAHGFGYLTNLGAKWEICSNWSIGLMGAYRNFRTRGGKEKTTLIDPILGHIRIRERFNGAKWHTWSISALIAWRF
jgi:Protochlamydia outer membrane protein